LNEKVYKLYKKYKRFILNLKGGNKKWQLT